MKTGTEKKCTLSDEELAEACRKLVHDLCQTGGQRWRMSVPVDFNNDSDMLFCELINRFKEASQFKQSSPDIGCKCPDNITHGETSIMCCNECGRPVEEFWTHRRRDGGDFQAMP